MKYIIEFKKTGVICYTSHLDIMKVFKRSFKRAGIRLAYSQGFNPHPKMGFAQPLSLGYEGLEEYIEFETAEGYMVKSGQEILDALKAGMPEGLELVSIKEAPELRKTLAAETVAAGYEIYIPLSEPFKKSPKETYNMYMGQPEITALKKQKKKKELVSLNIKPKIREIFFFTDPSVLRVEVLLDAGSDSNLSPELLISTLLDTLHIHTPRNEIDVTRTKIIFDKDSIQFKG